MHCPTYRIAHTMAFVTPVMETWLEQEIAFGFWCPIEQLLMKIMFCFRQQLLQLSLMVELLLEPIHVPQLGNSHFYNLLQYC